MDYFLSRWKIEECNGQHAMNTINNNSQETLNEPRSLTKCILRGPPLFPVAATGPPTQATGPPQYGAGVGVGMSRCVGDSLTTFVLRFVICSCALFIVVSF